MSDSANRGSWRDGVALAALTCLTLVFFWRILLTNRILAGLDVFAYFYPYRSFVSQSLLSGNLPLWNPHLFMGAPLLANSQAAVLYPLHWPLLWLSVPKQIAWSIGIHIVMAAAGTYLFSRRHLQLRPLAAWLSAVVFALGGFLGAQAEHLNQLNVSAWLPWLLLCVQPSPATARRLGRSVLLGGAVVGLILLAGHTQAAYIVLFGAAAYTATSALGGVWSDRQVRWFSRLDWRRVLGRLGMLCGMVLIGSLLAAAQLLPTLELSRLSVRSGGLPYQEAASFSLKPALLFKALLPPLAWSPPFSEYVAYVGFSGLALAGLGTWTILRRRRSGQKALLDQGSRHLKLVLLVLSGLGLFLAFGAYNPLYYLLYLVIPGFDLFRAPARWLLLYAFGMAILSGAGLDAIEAALKPVTPGRARTSPNQWHRRLTSAVRDAALARPGAAMLGIVTLVIIELLLARRPLAYNLPTAPAAVSSQRTAPAHIMADTNGVPFRFLSMSGIEFDPGDMADIQDIYDGQLSDQAIYDLVVATKMKEVLAYNLPLYYRIDSVDGYDGGLLPLARYVTLEQLFLPEELIWSDGRLRQQLQQVPPNNLLSLLNIKYIITDKLQDVWIDDVFYDLEHTSTLGDVTLTDLPPFPATHLGVVSNLVNAADTPQGTPVAEIRVACASGSEITEMLRAGIDTAERVYDANTVSHSIAMVGQQHLDKDTTINEYVTVLDFGLTCLPHFIQIRSLLPPGNPAQVALRGLTLLDRRSSTGRTLSVDPAYRLVHSGDVKIYENLRVLPRAFVSYGARQSVTDEDALEVLREPAARPGAGVVLAGLNLADTAPAAEWTEATILAYEPERVELEADLDRPGYLVLTDAYYPGWEVSVDGQPAEIQPATLYYRGVYLDAGGHHVEFRFRPASVRWGSMLSTGAAGAWFLALVAITVVPIGRNRRNVVE